MMHGFAGHPKSAEMSRVLDIRYEDLEEEKTLCQALLAWAEENCDAYATVFAHAYLGDYYLARNDRGQASSHLEKARELLNEKLCNSELEQKVYSFYAIVCEMYADEQNAIQYYLKSLVLARQLADVQAECMVLNNLGYTLQKHHSYEQALRYYEEAYALQVDMDNPPFRAVLLTNLAMLLLHLSRPAEALAYIKECEQVKDGQDNQRVHQLRNHCAYEAALGHREEALCLAEKILPLVGQLWGDLFTAFDNFTLLCESMLQIKSEKHARYFLEQMVKASQNGGLNQRQTLEKKRLEYYKAFGTEEEKHAAYKKFYKEIQELKAQGNRMVVDAMKDQINLDAALTQRQTLLEQQEQLEREANIDELTQLYNRRHMEYLMTKQLEHNGHRALAAVMLDVDYFKEFNDFYGHRKGDEVLRAVGACFRENATTGIYACRYGGDEFACLCEVDTEQELRQYIEKVRGSLQRAAIPHEKSYCSNMVTLSIGYAFTAGKGKGIAPYQLMQLADQALYETKRAGRNSVTGKQAE